MRPKVEKAISELRQYQSEKIGIDIETLIAEIEETEKIIDSNNSNLTRGTSTDKTQH